MNGTRGQCFIPTPHAMFIWTSLDLECFPAKVGDKVLSGDILRLAAGDEDRKRTVLLHCGGFCTRSLGGSRNKTHDVGSSGHSESDDAPSGPKYVNIV